MPSAFVISKNFRSMMSRSYAFNNHTFDSDKRWLLLEELYNKNYLDLPFPEGQHIPKKIHQIWLGGTIPDKYKRYADTWGKFNPLWEYKLWGDKDVKDMDLPNRKLFDSLTNYGLKSDIIRYYLMNKYGGLYIDTDFECLMPFDDFTYLDFFTSIGYNSAIEIYPGLMGCIPHHPIMEEIIKAIDDIRFIPNNPTAVLEHISSYFFTRIVMKMIPEYKEGIVIFPPDYFYPFPNQAGHKTRNGKDYVKDCSYAIHHWAVSWTQ